MRSISSVVSTLFLALAIVACGDKSAVAPVNEASGDVAVMTVTGLDLPVVSNGSTFALFDTAEIDTKIFGFGQNFLFLGDANTPSSSSIVLALGATANLTIASEGFSLHSDGVFKPTLQFITDWQAVSPEKHPGVQSSLGSDIFFLVNSWQLSQNGDVLDALPDQSFHQSGQAGNLSALITLPARQSISYAYPAQKRQITCLANDSLVFESKAGIVLVRTDADNKISITLPVQKMQVRCAIYTNISAARMAVMQRQP